jgi:hypothetical protein
MRGRMVDGTSQCSWRCQTLAKIISHFCLFVFETHLSTKKDNQPSLILVSMEGCETLACLTIKKGSSLCRCKEKGLMTQASVLSDAKLWLK